jgi:hypothetical protein
VLSISLAGVAPIVDAPLPHVSMKRDRTAVVLVFIASWGYTASVIVRASSGADSCQH